MLCLLFLWLTLVSIGCKRRVQISGQVVDSRTNAPVEGATVVLLEKLYYTSNTGDRSFIKKSGADGRFFYDFKDRGKEFTLRLSDDLFPDDTVSTMSKVYLGDPPLQTAEPVGKRGGEGILFRVVPVARFILIMERKAGKNLDSWAFSSIEGKKVPLGGGFGNPPSVLTRCIACPKGFVELEKESVVNGITTKETDTVPAKPFELIRHRMVF